MNATPRVSVVLPAYNVAGSLPAAVTSALNQSLASVEVVIADDGSSDGTAEVAADLARGDPRVRVLRAHRNAGAAAARNRAMKAARGDWVALLDADDRFAPDRLERLTMLGEARDADVIVDNLRLVDAAGEVWHNALREDDPLFGSELTAAAFVCRNLFLTGGFKLGYLKPLFRRRFLEAHDLRQNEALRIAEDFHFLLDCLLAGARVVADPEAGYDYRQAPGSLSRELSLADLRTLSAANRALLSLHEVRTDKVLYKALTRRQWSADLNINFMLFVEALKGRRMLAAGSIFARNPDLTPFLAFYGLESLRKRLPGGRRLV
ncbi:glycosyltransferase family 2 protein [Pelagibius sp. 7325]|uniref:glycosyltransferase family 2 protein n=1 Tax=Pelagibius sp. 7325 TaxID=3131994 RepID=UPI0030EC6723